ncbi:MAG: hypothetical protein WC346_06725 [Methanogenium sp.]|jgi:hypothetical protein
MKTLIIKGKHKNKEVEVNQWGFDWFTVNSGDFKIDGYPFTPTSLSFTKSGIEEIQSKPNYLLDEFEVKEIKTKSEYKYTFKKK